MGPHLVLRGGEATIAWAWHTAAVCSAWSITRRPGTWSLVATVQRSDPFKLQQRPLLFTVPRKGGHWCWPVKSVNVRGPRLTAALGPMEA